MTVILNNFIIYSISNSFSKASCNIFEKLILFLLATSLSQLGIVTFFLIDFTFTSFKYF